MTDHERMLSALTEKDAKQVYADWLEENGDMVGATAIRLSCHPSLESASLSDLIGETLVSVRLEGKEVLHFYSASGKRWVMQHNQDCCESVEIEDVCGRLNDLVGSPILMAEEATGSSPIDGLEVDNPYGTFTWTFYRFATLKGYVTIRWLGESNGYYSERVDFQLAGNPED